MSTRSAAAFNHRAEAAHGLARSGCEKAGVGGPGDDVKPSLRSSAALATDGAYAPTALPWRRAASATARKCTRRPGSSWTREAERVRQVGGADEQDVHPLDRRDLVDGGERFRGLDLERAEHLAVGVVERAGPAAPVPGARRPADAPAAAVAAGQRGQLRLRDRLDPRHEHAAGAEVERPADPRSPRLLDANEDRRGAAAGGEQLGECLGLAARAVLEVDDEPVEAGDGEDLDRQGAPEARERAEQRLAGEDAAPERASPQDACQCGYAT